MTDLQRTYAVRAYRDMMALMYIEIALFQNDNDTSRVRQLALARRDLANSIEAAFVRFDELA